MCFKNMLVLKHTKFRCCCVLVCLMLGIFGAPNAKAEQFNFQCMKRQASLTDNVNLRKMSIGLQVTNRVTHQVLSRIFAIFLREVIHYQNVQLIPIAYPLNNLTVGDQIFDTLNFLWEKNLNTQATMNLEVWISPMLARKPFDVADAGPSLSPGRFGWFVPTALIDNEMFYSLQSDIFRDKKNRYYQLYVLDEIEHQRLRQLQGVEVYESPACVNEACATLIAEHRPDTEFVIEHIKETKSYLNIIWLGDQFLDNVLRLYEVYANDKVRHGQRFAVLHWQPSELMSSAFPFTLMYMPRCEDWQSLRSAGCKYSLTPRLKFFKNDLVTDLTYSLRHFQIDDNELKKISLDLIAHRRQEALQSLSSDDIYNRVACNWLKNSTHIYSDWIYKRTIVRVGGIIPSSMFNRGHQQLEDIIMSAERAINSNGSILPNYNFEVVITDGNCQAGKVMKQFIYYFNKYESLLGVLGPGCSETVEPVAGISKHMNLPAISYSADGVSFADRQAYPYFFRTIGSNRQYVSAYISMMSALGWRRIAALTEDGQKYTEYLGHLESALKQHQMEMIVNKKFLSDVTAAEMNKNLLDLKARKAKIIIVDVHDRSAALAICEAYKLDMTAKAGYVWFLPTWLSRSLSEWQKQVNSSCSIAQLKEAIEGHFSIRHRPFGARDALMQEQITVGAWLSKHNESVSSDFAGYVYDAVWVYALAAGKLLRQNPEALNNMRSKVVTNRLMELIWQTDFHGLSGHVLFGEGGSRILPLDILQWQQTAYKPVGRFEPHIVGQGIHKRMAGGHLKLNFTALRWATGEQPDDGKYDCTFAGLAKFLGMGCEGSEVLFITALCILSVLCISLVSFLFWKRRYDHKLQRSAKIMKNFGIDLHSPSRNEANTLDKWEVPKRNVVVNRRLGEGAFGTVFGGEARIGGDDWLAVAVKTLKEGASIDDRIDFLTEAEAMKRFDNVNIIKLLGVCLQSEPIYTIMEFMLYGDLKTYLLARRNLVNEKYTDESDISPKRLTMYAMDVARGLAYLAERKYVHRDLACRNCLVNSQRVVKIGDFGMARHVHESDYYRFNRKGMLPVRWMAPESLSLGMFTTASDIWAFGVVIYEIITFGSYPYQGLTNNQVLDYVVSGNMLQIPSGAKPHLEALLRSCWSQYPKNRLTATEIIDYISSWPTLLTPCLDAPAAAIEMPESESDQLILLPKFRKCSPVKRPGALTILSSTDSATILADDLLQQQPSAYPANDNTNDSTLTSSETYSSVTPDGYSIMSPLLVHNSKSNESCQSDLLKLSHNANLQQTLI